jgi:hypothetical protein
MTRVRIFVIALIAATSSLSMYHDPAYDLLDDSDYARMRSDSTQGPALSAPLDGSPYWESYNQWLCFPTQKIEIDCLEAEYGEVRKLPVLHVTENSHYFEFSMDPEPAPDCDQVTGRWKILLKNEGVFCAYAAPLQELDVTAYDTDAEAGSVWIINLLKTSKGYWRFESQENRLHEEPDGPIEDR